MNEHSEAWLLSSRRQIQQQGARRLTQRRFLSMAQMSKANMTSERKSGWNIPVLLAAVMARIERIYRCSSLFL